MYTQFYILYYTFNSSLKKTRTSSTSRHCTKIYYFKSIRPETLYPAYRARNLHQSRFTVKFPIFLSKDFFLFPIFHLHNITITSLHNQTA